MSRDVSGIAKLTDHALELFLGQFRELLDERIDVDVVASHLLAEARVLSELPGRPHAIDTRIDATLPLVIEYAQRVGNRGKTLVHRIAAEEQAVLGARGEHAIRLFGA